MTACLTYPSVIGVPVSAAAINSRFANRCRLAAAGTAFGLRGVEGGR
ncbi:hypothetical protein Pd630_LPD00838 [Rhodococcus opacus PD630]|nr:hypothetical protein Pd630_LPD00838 [Rhodococcus opacus PD630]